MLETVVKNCAKIEKLLRARGAEGNGLKELRKVRISGEILLG